MKRFSSAIKRLWVVYTVVLIVFWIVAPKLLSESLVGKIGGVGIMTFIGLGLLTILTGGYLSDSDAIDIGL